jgi:hypothetical protein
MPVGRTLASRWMLLLTGALTLGACEPPSGAPASSPYLRPPTAAEQACVNQGHMRGTEDYEQCMARASGVPQQLPPPAVAPPVGVEAYRDEYGHRYDGRGNRVDGKGHIISSRSTQP